MISLISVFCLALCHKNFVINEKAPCTQGEQDAFLFNKTFVVYAGTTLKIPVRITSADQSPAPLQTIL